MDIFLLSLYSSGRETDISSLPRQVGVAEFQPKGGGLSLILMDQRQTNNPKCSPKWLPNKILGFAWQVATIAHTKEQSFLIGSFANLKFFIGQDIVIGISTNTCFLSTKFLPHTTLPHTYPK